MEEEDCANTPADDTDDSDIEPTKQSIISCESNSAAASISNRESHSAAASSSNRESNSAAASSSNFRLEGEPINKRKNCQKSDMMDERQKERNKVLQMITNDENDDVSLFFESITASFGKHPPELIN
ncbi:hypothetical protein JTB14_000778 [Gonioctena quinquepunctata]|nr:hypothetical protein JTB14_000778 [Gonioctena quinquepunctata]